MSYDLITEFLNYKIKRLRGYGILFFDGFNEEFLTYNLTRFFTTYVNTYYYHILDTLNSSEVYNLDVVFQEFLGLKEELLDEHSGYELLLSNEEYQKDVAAINEMVDICMFLCNLDQVQFTSRDNIADEFNAFISNYRELKDRLGNNIFKLITKLKENFTIVSKLFKDDDSVFKLNLEKKLGESNICLVRLDHDIKVLQSNYKEVLVKKVYDEDNFIIERARTLFWKLSKEILNKYLNGYEVGKYLVIVDDKLFQKSNLNIFSMIDNPILKRHVTLIVTYNCYGYHRNFIFDLGFKIGCIQDLSHNYDVTDKLNTIDGEEVFDYIIISDYREKDKDEITKFKCRDGVEFFITKEE